MNNVTLSSDDVLLVPRFSFIESRKDVDTSVDFLGLKLKTPLISSNMDSVTGPLLASEMALNGAIGALHRFVDIQANVALFNQTKDLIRNNSAYVDQPVNPMVSIGIGDNEFERGCALINAGATHVIIDVAHGAAIHVVKQYDRLREKFGDNIAIIVGNFASKEGINAFTQHSKSKRKMDAVKIGIGGGSMCITRVVTGCGVPTLGSVFDCSYAGYPIICDGSIRNSGDLVKVIAAGASVAMCGQLFASCVESPGEVLWKNRTGEMMTQEIACARKYNEDATFVYLDNDLPKYKKYRGSASLESYEIQGKVSEHRTPEGVSTWLQVSGTVKEQLTTLTAGLRSGMTYCNAKTLKELKDNAQFIRVTENGNKENHAHGQNE